METSLRAFRIAMYREHLEDAAFLYDQRNALLGDGETSWLRLHDFEERLEANIDALVIGGDLALGECRTRAAEGEPGELHAAVCVYCRRADSSLLAELWRALDFTDRAKVRAVTEALKVELPAEWGEACIRAIARGNAQLVPLLSIVCGSRRIAADAALTDRLAAQPELIGPETIWALSRSPARASAPFLESCCQHDDPVVRASALRALLCMGDRRLLRGAHLTAQTADWPRLALGLGGDRSAATVLRHQAEAGGATKDTLLALGLLGDLSAVRILYEYLPHEELGETAALALHTITGAALYDQEFVPEPIDPRELLETELAAWRERGEVPRRIDGRPFGHVLQRLTRDPARWEDWLRANMPRFDARLRYRRGQPCSPAVLLQCLLDESSPRPMRQLAYEELVIRYGCVVPFESDWRVADQRSALRAIADWVLAEQSRGEPGAWP